MKNWLKILFAAAFLAVVSSAWSQQTISLGYTGSSSIDIDLNTNYYASVTLTQNGNSVLVYDTVGVLYAAPGVSWSQNGGYITVYSLPSGSYTATMVAMSSTTGYVSSTDYISWSDSAGNYAYAYFIY